MKSFLTLFPGKIYFGFDSIKNIYDFNIKNKNILIITGKTSYKKSGAFSKINNILKKNNKIYLFNKVEPEVSSETVDKASLFAKKNNINFFIGIGGGSVLDCAKAVSVIYKTQHSVKDFLDGKAKIKKRKENLILIPLTAGTGSEITRNSVLNYTEKRLKLSLRSEFLIPDIVIEDPLLTISLPKKITAYSGMDALTHAIESYFSINANDYTKTFALKSINLIINNLYNAYKNGENKTARYNMMLGSLFATFSFSVAGLGAAHGISHPIGALTKLPHGLLNAILLPHVLEFNYSKIKKELKELNSSINIDLISEVKKINKKLNIKEKISFYYKKIDIEKVLKSTLFTGSMSYNPVKMDEKKVIKILKKVI